jgi:hypothetical protein
MRDRLRSFEAQRDREQNDPRGFSDPALLNVIEELKASIERQTGVLASQNRESIEVQRAQRRALENTTLVGP